MTDKLLPAGSYLIPSGSAVTLIVAPLEDIQPHLPPGVARAVLDALRADVNAAAILAELDETSIDITDVTDDALAWLQSYGFLSAEHEVTALGRWACRELEKDDQASGKGGGK